MSSARTTLTAMVLMASLTAGRLFAQPAPPRTGQYYGPDANGNSVQQPSGQPGATQLGAGQPGAGQPPQRPDGPRGPGQPQNAPRPPFQLTPQQRDDLNKTLVAWENKSGQMKSFKCDFVRFEYDPVFFPTPKGQTERPKTQRWGEIKYVAPDKGLIHEKDVAAFNQATQKFEPSKTIAGEYWICDGKFIYQVDDAKREVKEIPIPPELQGQAISQGPLPFVFNAKADDLQKRYYIRDVTPPVPPGEANDQVWLEILPKFQRDAANFSQIKVILSVKDMFPQWIQIVDPGGQNRDVYQFTQKSTNLLDLLGGGIFSPPFTYKHIRENLPAANPPPGSVPGAGAHDGQAQRPPVNGPPLRK